MLWSLLVLPFYNQSNILSKTEVISILKNEEKFYHAHLCLKMVKV